MYTDCTGGGGGLGAARTDLTKYTARANANMANTMARPLYSSIMDLALYSEIEFGS
jgi:hypothetical protein